MRATWITPTWNRPKLLGQLVRQFLDQTYDAEQLDMLILDDAGQYHTQLIDKRIHLISFYRPFATLPEKYNALLGMIDHEGCVVIAEDDDLYAPDHTLRHVQALEKSNWSKPSRVWTDVGGVKQIEPAAGRFHASIAARVPFLRSTGGWPITRRADFDLMLLARLSHFGGNPADPAGTADPTYTFTWEKTGHYHAQAYGRGPDDENWLSRAREAAGPIHFVEDLRPMIAAK